VAKIQPTSKQERKHFRQGLAPEQREAFDDLAGLIDAHRTDLAWYHAVGVVVARLLPPEVRERGGVRWLETPARVFGHDVSQLQKPLRFHKEYPALFYKGNLRIIFETSSVPVAKTSSTPNS
jgi:hypothetical protein